MGDNRPAGPRPDRLALANSPTWSASNSGELTVLRAPDYGNLVISSTSGPVWTAIPAASLSGPGAGELALGDHCTFAVTAPGVTSTKSTSCTVVNYTFEKADGSSRFGSAMRTTLTATDNGTARLDSGTVIELDILGGHLELLSASGYQTEKVTAEWSHRLFSWTGLEWDLNLFNKSGGFWRCGPRSRRRAQIARFTDADGCRVDYRPPRDP